MRSEVFSRIFQRLKDFFANKKNRYIVLGSVLLLGLMLGVLVLAVSSSPVQSFFEITDQDESGTLRVKLTDEKTGESLTLEEPEEIANLYALLSRLQFQRRRGGTEENSWAFTVDLFHAERDFLRARFTDHEAVFVSYAGTEGRGYITRELGFYEVDTTALEASLTSSLEIFYGDILLARAEKEAAEKEEAEEEEEIIEITVKEIEPAITVIINNHPASRPSSGLQKADYVYEFLVEGGSTRYLAVFRTLQEANFNIGPIRSLRPYFAVQSLEHGGIVAHSGYSARTREMISGLGVFQIADTGNNFWRDSSRRAPHNLYSNINNLYRAAGDRPRVVERTYQLKGEKPEDYQEVETVEIAYSPHNRVFFEYNAEDEKYYRFINGEPHTELETGEQFSAVRVIIRETPHRNVPGPDGLVDIELHGSGRGTLYEGGRAYQVSWSRTGSETIYEYEQGGEVQPIPGQTWIQVVRQ